MPAAASTTPTFSSSLADSDARDLRTEGEEWGLLTAPLIEDGRIAPPDGPGWGAVWDEDRVRSLTVATD